MSAEDFSIRFEHRSSGATVNVNFVPVHVPFGLRNLILFNKFTVPWHFRLSHSRSPACLSFVLANSPIRIDFPPEVIRGETLFTNMIIDETTSQPNNNCDDVFVYITDTVEPGELPV